MTDDVSDEEWARASALLEKVRRASTGARGQAYSIERDPVYIVAKALAAEHPTSLQVFSIPAEQERRDKEPPRPLQPGERENRWVVDRVRCMDCRTQFALDDTCIARDIRQPDVDTLTKRARTRMLILTVPECCPNCHNLRPVKVT